MTKTDDLIVARALRALGGVAEASSALHDLTVPLITDLCAVRARVQAVMAEYTEPGGTRDPAYRQLDAEESVLGDLIAMLSMLAAPALVFMREHERLGDLAENTGLGAAMSCDYDEDD